MKKPYVTLELNILIFKTNDVVRTSGNERRGDDNVGFWEEQW